MVARHHGRGLTLPNAPRSRADVALVARGHFPTRARAQAAIAAGLVTADGRVVARASEPIGANARIEARAPHPWVSRGGVKLAAALDAFALDPAGLRCLDVGASTGGFTDVLRARGAAHVVAVDVGTGQFDASLRAAPNISVIENCDARALTPDMIGAPPQAIVCDVSFISLRLALPPVLALAGPKAWLVALIKPQFEAGRAHLVKGAVKDEAVFARVCDEVRLCVEALGWTTIGIMPSPIPGGDGAKEFLYAARHG